MPATTAALNNRIDPRAARFGAGITSLVLIGAIIAGPRAGLILLAIQIFAFGAGALLGPRSQPYGYLFRRLIRPHLGAPEQLEDERPPRFAQAVGFVFALTALVGSLTQTPALYYSAAGFALAAALLNAIFDFCLGCELYLLGLRLRERSGGQR